MNLERETRLELASPTLARTTYHHIPLRYSGFYAKLHGINNNQNCGKVRFFGGARPGERLEVRGRYTLGQIGG